MKTLFLLRHAHAEARVLGDIDRALDERGKREAVALAAHLQDQKITFDFVMCSSALRALETLEPLRQVIGTQEIEISSHFYNTSEHEILHHIQRVSDKNDRILYIGHNPGIAFAMLRLSKNFPDVLKEGVHPATLIGLQFPLDKWMDLKWGEGKILDVFQPEPVPTEFPAPKES